MEVVDFVHEHTPTLDKVERARGYVCVGARVVKGVDSRFHPHVEEVTETLVERFGRPTLGNKKNPFNELIYIILSSRTPPENCQDTYRSLRRSFRTADSLAEANPDRVAG